MEQWRIDQLGRMIAEGAANSAGASRLPDSATSAPCICNLGGVCDTLCINRKRLPDSAKVRTRTVEFTADQMLLKQLVDRSLPEICPDAETGIALLSYFLSELILRTARPGLLPEAVATAVQVLQFNCGIEVHAQDCQCSGCVGSRG